MSVALRAPVVALCLALVATSARAAGPYDPALTWRTVSTPRFDVHYHDGARNLAVRVGRIAEQELDAVGRLLGFVPEGTIDIVLIDSSDDANGSAQVMPKNTLRLYLAAPTELTGLSEYDDWLRILVVHELAHLCDLDQSWGVTRLLRLLFGKYISMNSYAPQFLSEGVAVYAETLLTSTGRGRSSYVAMLLRAAALDGTFLEIDQAHIQLADWPRGNGAYFYGGLFHLWLRQRYGEAAVRDLHRYYAAMPVPYVYWPGAKSVLGKGLTVLWDEWRAEEEAFAREVQATVSARGVTASRRLTFHGRNITGARYSPDGSFIIYSRSSPVDGATVRRIDRDGGGDRHLVLETFSPRFSFAPDGASFYFSQAATTERFNAYQDLFRYELASDETVRLRDAADRDRSLRARDPDVSPDGQRVVFVQNALHQSWVSVGTLGGEERDELSVRVLVPPVGDMQHASPRFSPDGRQVAVATWFEGGYRDLVIVDAESGALVRRVTYDKAQDGNPAWSRDGRYLLFESDLDGISNLYAFDTRDGARYRVTNVVGGAFQPEVSPDGATLLFRDASGVGFDIHEMPYRPETWQRVEESHDAKAPEGWRTAPLPAGAPRQSELPLPLLADERDGDYAAWKSLVPFRDNWLLIPALYAQNGELTASLTTFGMDTLGEQSYALRVGSSLHMQRLDWAASYANDMGYPTLFVGGGDQHVRYEPRVSMRRRSGYAGASLPLAERHLLALTYSYERRTGLTARAQDELTLGGASYVEAGYRYRLARYFPYSVGAEQGASLALSGRWYGQALGADFDEGLVMLDARGYLNNPLFDNHVLALRFDAAMALGPEFDEQFFLGGAAASSIVSVQTEQVFPLRGFELSSASAGTGLAAAYAEYRFPLVQVQRGLWTLPVFLERLHVALFVDAGATFGDGGEESVGELWHEAARALTHPRVGVGGEARADLSIGWEYPLTLRLGAGVPLVRHGDVGVTAPVYFLAFGSAI